MTYKENKKEAQLPPGDYADNGLSDKTVNKWNQYFRWLCAQDIKRKHKKVGGRSMVVEMDESLFGKASTPLKNNRVLLNSLVKCCLPPPPPPYL